MSNLDIRSGVGARSGAAFVTLHWGDEAGQMTAEEALLHGVRVIACAQAALDDAALVRLLRKVPGMDNVSAWRFLAEVRAQRGNEALSGEADASLDPLSPEDFPGQNGGPS